MKTEIVPLIGDPTETLYQLGLKEREAFLKLEERVSHLLSTNNFLRYGQDIISRARMLLKKKDHTLFEKCINRYAEGMGIESHRYQSFLSLFELAAHYGQVYPELKGLLPGCTSVLSKTEDGITHARLLDFPLIGIFDSAPKLYYWKFEGKSFMNYSCEGLAPLFLQGIHGSGFSMALHHKPGKTYHRDGQSIFQIAFDTIFETANFQEFRREIRKKVSVTKWSFILLEKSGQVQSIDIDGPAMNSESFNVHESGPLIFTNIPIQKDAGGYESYLKFSEDRQSWLKQKLSSNSKNVHLLDLMTDVEDQKTRRWIHPCATLSTVAAYQVNLTTGILDVKENEGAVVQSDGIVQFSLADPKDQKVLKKEGQPTPFEQSWKRASLAQSYFDQGAYDKAYHELQMSLALMPNSVWKEILSFYLYVWDFKFVGNNRELAMVYKKLKRCEVPEVLKDQWIMLIMRFEKKLGLAPSVGPNDVSPHMRDLFIQEREASNPAFSTWMKLLYPRMDLLDVFSPHKK